MRVEIFLDTVRPPSGVVRVENGPGLPFTGWLGLIDVLSRAFDADSPPGVSRRGGGEVPARGHPPAWDLSASAM